MICAGSVHFAANVAVVAVLGYGSTMLSSGAVASPGGSYYVVHISLRVSGAMTAGELTAFLVYSMFVGGNMASMSTLVLFRLFRFLQLLTIFFCQRLYRDGKSQRCSNPFV